MTGAGEDVEKLPHLGTVDGNPNGAAPLESGMMVPPSIKHGITLMIQQPHFGVYTPKNWKQDFQEISVCPQWLAVLFTRAKMWKQTTGPLMDEWINKMWCRQTMGYYYSALKGRQFWTHYRMDEPQGHYAKWNTPVTKKPNLCYSIYMRCLVWWKS